MKNNIIEAKTCLLPEIIAQGAIWDVLEADYPGLTPEQCHKIEATYTPFLTCKADRLYRNNLQFRRGITSNEKGRNLLWAYMAHWFKAEYLRDKKKSRLTPII